MDIPGLSPLPQTNRAAQRSLWWRLGWSVVGAFILSIVTLLTAERLFPRALAGFAPPPARPEAAVAPDRLPAAAAPPLSAPPVAPRVPRRKKRKDPPPEEQPEALVAHEPPTKPAPSVQETSRHASWRPSMAIVPWIKSVANGGAFGNRFFSFHRKEGAPMTVSAAPTAAGAAPALNARVPLLETTDQRAEAAAPVQGAAGVGDRPVPLEWGESVGSPVLVAQPKPAGARGRGAPDVTRGSDVTPEELRAIRAEDQRTLTRLEYENLALRTVGGAVLLGSWILLFLFASGAVFHFRRPWGAEVSASETALKLGRRR